MEADVGVLTDIVIASESEAEEVAAATVPIKRWAGLDIKGHNEVTLGILSHILNGGNVESLDLDSFVDGFDCLAAKSQEEGPWVTRLPAPLVRFLAGLSDEGASAAGKEWCRAEELQDADPAYCCELLLQLRDLAQRAEAEEKTLLMWNSL